MTQPAAPPLVRLQGVAKSYGGVVAVRPLDLEIRTGDFLAIVGPSGCGKTTLLNMIAGFIAPDAGRIEIAGADVTRLGPERRPTNMVFQSYGLFPHMTVRQNIAYGLRIAKVAPDEIRRRVKEMVDLVHLEGLEDRSVQHLSGGQAQRVALSRALVMRPKVLLLDEPLAALDLQLRKAMQEELRRIHHSIGGTFVFVTHDQEEAMRLANRIAVMQAGRLIQDGSAEEIYARPKTLFVSTFVGEANIFRGERRGGEVRLEIGAAFAAPGPDGRVAAVVRPQAMAIAARGGIFRRARRSGSPAASRTSSSSAPTSSTRSRSAPPG
ncbi:MAG: ABC transporter ATP-binding protein [Dongiaceae bacterium]